MRRQIIAFTVLLSASPACAGRGPVIAFDSESHWFGTRYQGSVIEHAFVVRNDGDADLIISGTKASCGCTAVASGANLLRPGERTEIRASVDTNKRGGAVKVAVTVQSSDPVRPSVGLMLEANVLRAARFDPRPAIVMNAVKAGSGGSGSVRLWPETGGELRIRSVESATNYLAVSHGPVRGARGQAGAEIKAVLRKDVPAGRLEEHVRVGVDVGKITGLELDLPVMFVVEGGLEMKPARYIFGYEGEGKRESYTVEIRRKDGKPLEIAGIHCDRRGVRAEVVRGRAADRAELRLDFNPREPGVEPGMGRVEMRVGLPGEPLAFFPFVIKGRAPPKH